MDKPRERIQAQNYATMGIYNQDRKLEFQLQQHPVFT